MIVLSSAAEECIQDWVNSWAINELNCVKDFGSSDPRERLLAEAGILTILRGPPTNDVFRVTLKRVVLACL